MEIKQIVPGFSAAPQLLPEEIAEAAKLGYSMLICNRPDGEAPDQPGAAEMQAAAEAAGLDFAYLPVVPGGFTPTLITEMRMALDAAKGPVLAYCRSGTRSTMLWGLAEAGERPAAEIIAAAAEAGYDLSPLAMALNARS